MPREFSEQAIKQKTIDLFLRKVLDESLLESYCVGGMYPNALISRLEYLKGKAEANAIESLEEESIESRGEMYKYYSGAI